MILLAGVATALRGLRGGRGIMGMVGQAAGVVPLATAYDWN